MRGRLQGRQRECPTIRVETCSPFCTSHSRAVASMLPVATRVLCGLNARQTCIKGRSTLNIN